MGTEIDHPGIVVLKALDAVGSRSVIPVDDLGNYLSACGYSDLVKVRALNENGQGMMGDDRRPLGAILGGLEIIGAVQISRKPNEVTQSGVVITETGNALLRMTGDSHPSVMSVLRQLPRNLALLLVG